MSEFNDINELEKWEKLLESEWLGDIDNQLSYETNYNKNVVKNIIEDIEDIEDNIEINNEDWILKFYLDNELIWIIEYSKAKNNEIYIDMIWNINADVEDFDKYDFKERYNFDKKDIKIKWLVYFMYEKFFKILKNKWYKLAFWAIENNNLYFINEELLNRWIIKKTYIRKNKFNREELVREF